MRKCIITSSRGVQVRRHGGSAVEYAVCLPLMLMILAGLWEVGRITEVQKVMWNSAREAARDASLGEDNLQTVASQPARLPPGRRARRLSRRVTRPP